VDEVMMRIVVRCYIYMDDDDGGWGMEYKKKTARNILFIYFSYY
jgi:hypothetical protein